MHDDNAYTHTQNTTGLYTKHRHKHTRGFIASTEAYTHGAFIQAPSGKRIFFLTQLVRSLESLLRQSLNISQEETLPREKVPTENHRWRHFPVKRYTVNHRCRHFPVKQNSESQEEIHPRENQNRLSAFVTN